MPWDADKKIRDNDIVNESEFNPNDPADKAVKTEAKGMLSPAFTGESLLGNGKDGSAVLSSDTTLNEDKYYQSLKVESGVSLDTNGYKVYVVSELENNGIIHNDGEDGGDGIGAGGSATAGSGGSGGGGGTLAEAPDGGAGGAGTSSSANDPGENGTNTDPSLGIDGAAGGDPGGNAGSATSENGQFIREMQTTIAANSETGVSTLLRFFGASSGGTLSNSAGSGGGGTPGGTQSFHDNGAGGGAGGTGGIVYIFARTITNNGTIRSNGGDGGNGADGSGGGAAGSGGAGGSGGVVVLGYYSLTQGTIQVSGGAKGVSGSGGQNEENDGAPGNQGNVYRIKFT